MSLFSPKGGATPSNRASLNTGNRGGTILNAGNTDGTIITSGIPLVQNATNRGFLGYGSQLITKVGTSGVSTDQAGVQRAVASSPFAYGQVATGWMMPYYMTTLGGSGTSAAYSTPGGDWLGNGINRAHVFATSGTRMMGSGALTQFNFLARPSGTMQPGRTRGAGYGALNRYVAPSGAGDQPTRDNAVDIYTARHVPGEITYMYGAIALPSSGFYRPRDVFES